MKADGQFWRRIIPRMPAEMAQMALPLVSVVITAYNYEGYVGNCLNSILTQTYTKLECFVVDDASTDRTREIVEETIKRSTDTRAKLVSNHDNVGQLAAQSIGFALCSGVFVVFVDADDMLMPNFIERQVATQLNTEFPSGLCVSDLFTIDEKGMVHSGTRLDRANLAAVKTGRRLTIKLDDDSSPIEAVFLPRQDEDVQAPGRWYWQSQSAMLFRRSVLGLIMPPPSECGGFRICSDNYLARFAHLVASTTIIIEPLACYRQHSSNSFSSAAFLSVDQQNGDMSLHPSREAYSDLVRETIRRRQKAFFARLGETHTQQILATLFDPPQGEDEVSHPARRWWPRGRVRIPPD